MLVDVVYTDIQNLLTSIIEDKKKYFYYRGLKEFLNEPGYLIDTCYDGQDTIKRLLEYFDIEYALDEADTIASNSSIHLTKSDVFDKLK